MCLVRQDHGNIVLATHTAEKGAHIALEQYTKIRFTVMYNQNMQLQPICAGLKSISCSIGKAGQQYTVLIATA
jgi:hypothetical protein